MNKHGLFQVSQKVFFIKQNQVLVLRDRKSKFGDLPGGRMNQDEFFKNWIESLKREILEELGNKVVYKIYEEPIFVHKHIVEEDNAPCLIISYIGHFIEGELLLSDEHEYYKWVSIKNYNPKEIFTKYMLDVFTKFQTNFSYYSQFLKE